MGFIIMLTLSVILSAGILTITWAREDANGRLSVARRFGSKRLRAALTKAAAEAGKRVAGIRTAGRRERVHKELYSALSILRNHASAGGDEGGYADTTTDQILEQLSLSEGTLQDAYSGTLRLLRTGRRSEAASFFSAAADTELARDFIMLVLDWDAVPPYKLKRTVAAFQNALKETRTTELMRKNEVLSDIIYIPVIAGVLLVFVNFIYVAYFAEQRELLAELFF